MTRLVRNSLKSALGILIAGILIVAVSISVLRSDWFRDKVHARIVEEAERATGGRVEFGAFHFDWHSLTVELDNVVIHGTEPAGTAPLLAIDRAIVGLRIISLLERTFDIARVSAAHPFIHLIVNPDGSTNVPQPRVKSTKSPIATILDLKIGQFDVANGLILAESPGRTKPTSATPWSVRGSNLAARINWIAIGSKYDGTLAMDPVHFTSGRSQPLDARIEIDGSLERNQVLLRRAYLHLTESEITLTSVSLRNFSDPVIAADYTAVVSAKEATRILNLKISAAGVISTNGKLQYQSTSNFNVTGQLKSPSLDYGAVHRAAIETAFDLDSDRIDLTGAHVKWQGAEAQGSARLDTKGNLSASGKAARVKASDLTALKIFGVVPAKLPYDGLLTGPFQASGRLDTLKFAAHVAVAPAPGAIPATGDLDIRYDLLAHELRLAPSWIELPHSRVDASGVFGVNLAVKARSTDLHDLQPLLEITSPPPAVPPAISDAALQNGSVEFAGNINGSVTGPIFAGHADIQNLLLHGQKITSAAADLVLSRDLLRFTDAALTTDQLSARLSGSLGLSTWTPGPQSPVNATIRLANGNVSQLLTLAGAGAIPLSGTANAGGQLTGTLSDPHATADFTLARGQIYGQSYDQISGHAQYRGNGVETLTAVVTAGPLRANLTTQFEHAPGALLPAHLTFDLTPSAFNLNQVALVHDREPGISAAIQGKVSGAIEISDNGGHTRVALTRIEAKLDAQRLVFASRNLGEIHLTTTTANGVVATHLDSSLPGATLHGDGTVGLSTGYPVQGKFTFANANLGALAALLEAPGTPVPPLDGTATGELTLSGSARSPGKINASLTIPQLSVRPSATASNSARKFELHNDGPVKLALESTNVRIDAAHLIGPNTDITLAGFVPLNTRALLNVGVHGNFNLALAEMFQPGLSSSGTASLNAQVRGTWLDPDVSGRADVAKGEFRYADYSNGLTNANGVLVFTGSRATIQNLSAESGGGKVEASGFAALTGGRFAFRLDLKTTQVRVRYPAGVSSVSDSQLTVAGTSQRSDASGTVVVRRVAINPKADAATILARTAQPFQVGAGDVGALANMNLDVQITTAPDVVFETSLAQSIQADANLRLRGTLNNPALLGRINVTQGEVTFFGNRYTLNQGSISFFNPARIDPILNVDLETKARGVDVILNATGPIDKLNVTYRSDPPLQFGDIVALLATGRTPNDPTLAVRDTGQQASFQDVGASALLGQALANPVADRLQRFFGVSKIKIDPQLTGVTGSPEARLTIEQQVTPDILFTYISDVSNTSTQLIRVEWAFNRRWSAILTREENGYVGVDFAFKKHFK